MKPNKDELLDHEIDGIREFDNSLPRWWLYGFYVTMIFAAVYLVNYHVLPRPLVGQKGMVAEYEAELRAAAAAQPKPKASSSAALVAFTDRENLEAGLAIFEGPRNACFSCHRPDLGGLVGPNLTDDNWRHGCTLQEITNNIRTGFPAKGMMPFGVGQPLTDTQVLQVASYVLSKHGSHPPNPKPVEPDDDKPCVRP